MYVLIQESTLLDYKARIAIRRLGSFSLSPLQDKEHKEIYTGTDNRVELARFYYTKFLCKYAMEWYPFDSQTCQMTFHVQGSSVEFVNLVSQGFNYSGPTELTQYFIKRTTMENVIIAGVQMVQVEVILGRRLLSIILTVYFPTLLLNIIGYTTNFFKDFFFEAIVTVNLTAMLVLATMFISVSNNLPKTSCNITFKCS